MLQEDKMDIKKLIEDKVDSFNKQGYIHLKNVIEPNIVAETRHLAIQLRKKYKDQEGQDRTEGGGVFWKGLEMASILDTRLWGLYTHPNMKEIAKTFLQIEEPYLYNDQVVVKLPNDNFYFHEHCDNDHVVDPEGAKQGKFKTINCCQILTNMTDLDVGPLCVTNLDTGDKDIILANAGDIVIIDGNTPHTSTPNISNKIRALYACVYSSHPIGKFKSGFYNEKFQ